MWMILRANVLAGEMIAKKSPFVLPMKAGIYHFCTCGLSPGQPFCDGSHAKLP